MSFMEVWPLQFQRRRRVRIFDVSFEALAGLLQLDGSCALKVDGFPEGAVLSFIESDNERGVLRLYVEHESFAQVPEGALAPTWSPITVTRYNLPSAVVAEAVSQ